MTYSLYGYADRRPKYEIMRNIPHVKSTIIARNTVLYTKEDGCIGVRLHSTTIFEEFPDSWHVSYGGWPTLVTERRINLAIRRFINPEWKVWRIGSRGEHDFYLFSKHQCVPIGNGLTIPKLGGLPERTSSQDFYLRKHQMWWISKWGQSIHPNFVEWDGRSSTLRYLLLSERALPSAVLCTVKGLQMKGFFNPYRWSHDNQIMRWRVINKPILIRNRIEDVLSAGHINNLKFGELK
jgi:hypothetical protein